MGTIKTKGVILVERNMGDFDKMLTMLTPGLGKISCAARGAKKFRSSLLVGSQFLCFGEYILYKTNSTYYINSCEPIEVFYNIRKDLIKLEYASFISKIIIYVTNENEYSYRILQLYLNTLYMISETDKDLDFILSIFKIKLISILGFTPNVRWCTNCNSKEKLEFFSLKENGFKCNICGKQDTSAIHIQSSTEKAIKYIIMSPPKKVFSFNIGEEAIKELELIAKLYLNDKLEKDYKMDKMF